MKAQSSVEFMTIVGIALVVIAPVVAEAMGTISDIDQSEQSSNLQAELNDLEDKIIQVIDGNEKTTRTDDFSLPDNVQEVELRDRFMLITLNGTNNQNITRVFEKNLTGKIPTTEGLHRLKIENIGDSVEIQEIER